MVVSNTIGHEAVFFCISILVGAGLFFLYDVLRIFRRIVSHGVIWISIEDIVYWLIYTGVVFVMLYQQNDGMVRGFALFGLAVGMLCYYALLSRYVVLVQVFLWKKVSGYTYRVLHFFLGPFVQIGKKVGRFLLKQLKKLVRAVKISLCKL